jgi:hypothetical protein
VRQVRAPVLHRSSSRRRPEAGSGLRAFHALNQGPPSSSGMDVSVREPWKQQLRAVAGLIRCSPLNGEDFRISWRA